MVLRNVFEILLVIFVCIALNACSTLGTQGKPTPIPATKSASQSEKKEIKPLNIFKPGPPVTQESQEIEEADSANVRKEESLVSSLLGKAENALKSRQWLRTQRVLEQALRVEPINPSIFLMYGDLYQEMGAPDKAQSMYKRALYLAKGDQGIQRKAENKLSAYDE